MRVGGLEFGVLVFWVNRNLKPNASELQIPEMPTYAETKSGLRTTKSKSLNESKPITPSHQKAETAAQGAPTEAGTSGPGILLYLPMSAVSFSELRFPTSRGFRSSSLV